MHKKLVPEVKEALNRFKLETSNDLVEDFNDYNDVLNSWKKDSYNKNTLK